MKEKKYRSMESRFDVNRRDFLKTGGAIGAGIVVLGHPKMWAREISKNQETEKTKTNIDEVLKIPRTKYSMPGLYPGKVVEVHDPKATVDSKPVPEVVDNMFEKGIEQLTGKGMKKSVKLFFDKNDVIGIKVNPVGAGIISTRLELVDAIIDWLLEGGMKRENIIIWDRFDFMLYEAGFVPERFPGIECIGLQTMDEDEERSEKGDTSRWLREDGTHVSADNFDKDVYYWADVEGPKDLPYLHQHVFNGKYSYFGKLLTKRLTKMINVPAFKNTGNSISMATKNMGYGAVCNTNRLHKPLFFDVNVEVMAFPAVRDKLVLNITDGLIGQYDGGPMGNAQFTYDYNTLFFATDAFALDRICHDLIVEKRKSMGVKVNEHPMYTEYFKYAERIGLAVTDVEKIEHMRV